MQTRQDMETELVSRLMTANNSTLFPPTRITSLIKDAHLWATTLHFWPSLQRGRATYTVATQDYYDYPSDYITDSIARLEVDGIAYDKKAFLDFRAYVDNTQSPPDSTKHYFADYGRHYFIWPVPTVTTTGNNRNIKIWGNIQGQDLANLTDKTIFSLWDDSGNEAIVRKAFSSGLKRIEPQLAVAEETGAAALLAVIWQRVTSEMQRAQRLDHPFFQVPDMFGQQGGVSSIGNFGIDVKW